MEKLFYFPSSRFSIFILYNCKTNYFPCLASEPS